MDPVNAADPTTTEPTDPSAGTASGEAGEPPASATRPGWRRDATIFLTGQTVSLFGSMLVQYAIMWHLTLTTKSGAVMALASVFGFLPQAVVSIFGGVWADRLDRKKLIIGADATIAVTTLALAMLMLNGADSLWLIYARCPPSARCCRRSCRSTSSCGSTASTARSSRP